MKIQDMLSTGVCVLLVSKAEGGWETHRIELLEEEERERATPTVQFSDTGKCRHFSNSDLSRQQGMVKRERHVVNQKVPQHTPFHFLLVSSKILVFAESF